MDGSIATEMIRVSFSRSQCLGLGSCRLDAVSTYNEGFMALCISQFELMDSESFHVPRDTGRVCLCAL